ncbi:DNA repair protein RecO [Selenomonas ruminantium]|uniref:DNA repair protein RecO n=1 Tax=Selenomonas ruminantium TaxID=971 RepID=A0A1H0TKC3_SELRU|nr:DNA repair protein RecO [Selenomonas ruminantium]SDP53966.1 DNA replication and repair protein RecO [Selenomonas ruminantium]
MGSYQTAAVVLGSRNWGEADKMVTLFTADRGLVEAAAFGCRRPRSPLAAGMQMFSSIEVQLSEGRRLDTVRQCTLKRHYKKLTEDLEVMAYGSFVAEFLREFLPPGQAEPQMFARLLYILDSFEVRNPRVTALMAVIQLLEFTGMQLHFEHCVHCGSDVSDDALFSMTAGGILCTDCQEPGAQPFPDELRRFILMLRDYNWEKPQELKITGNLLMQAEQLFLNYLQSLLGRPLKSLAFIQQLA